MRSLSALLALIAALFLPSAALASDPPPLAAAPAVVAAGQPVMLRWRFGGNKVVLLGGRFGKGVDVTGYTFAVDRPSKTTRYAVYTWYKDSADPARAAGEPGRSVKVRYETVVKVTKAPGPPLRVYRDPHGWQVQCRSGWKNDVVALPDPARNGLVFFQQEDDSVDRLAVSMLPGAEMSAAELMERVRKSLAGSYAGAQVLTSGKVRHLSYDAEWMTFTGVDMTHPGVKTTSMVLALVEGGRAYVVSARAAAARFEANRQTMQAMVTSFLPAIGSAVAGRPAG